MMTMVASLISLVDKLVKMVNSGHLLNGSIAQLLDKTAIIQFANEVITIIHDIVEDPIRVNLSAEKIINTIKGEA